MVRIPGPSDFNHSPDRRLGVGGHRWELRASNRGGPGVLRQLFRLGVLLGLVVVVMRGASRPGVYEPFFAGEPSQADVGRSSAGVLATTGPSETNDLARSTMRFSDSSDSQTDRSASPQIPAGGEAQADSRGDINPAMTDRALRSIVESIPTARRGEWMAWLQRIDDPVFEGVLDGRMDPISDSGQLADSEIRSWVQANELSSAALTRQIALDGLRRDAMSRVVDGSVFRASDADALYDWLSRIAASSIAFDQAPRVGAIAMLQQPEVYRGQPVEVAGKIARVERVPAGENPFGIKEFFRLWIQPSTGANRPIAVMTPSSGPTPPEEGQSMIARGIFFKRLAYRSGIGADLAPLVVAAASIAQTRASTRDDDSGQGSPDDYSMGGIAIGWWLAIALVMGVGIAVAVMAGARQSQRRLRAIRAQMPVEIAELPTTSSSADGAGGQDAVGTQPSTPDLNNDPLGETDVP